MNHMKNDWHTAETHRKRRESLVTLAALVAFGVLCAFIGWAVGVASVSVNL